MPLGPGCDPGYLTMNQGTVWQVGEVTTAGTHAQRAGYHSARQHLGTANDSGCTSPATHTCFVTRDREQERMSRDGVVCGGGGTGAERRRGQPSLASSRQGPSSAPSCTAAGCQPSHPRGMQRSTPCATSPALSSPLLLLLLCAGVWVPHSNTHHGTHGRQSTKPSQPQSSHPPASGAS
jgi:hypothetical protein